MTGKSEYRLHSQVIDDIFEITSYIAQDSPTAALTLIGTLFDTFGQLAAFPRLGHRNSKVGGESMRFYVVGNYLIIYSPDEKPLTVYAVIDGRRSPNFIAALLLEREERE